MERDAQRSHPFDLAEGRNAVETQQPTPPLNGLSRLATPTVVCIQCLHIPTDRTRLEKQTFNYFTHFTREHKHFPRPSNNCAFLVVVLEAPPKRYYHTWRFHSADKAPQSTTVCSDRTTDRLATRCLRECTQTTISGASRRLLLLLCCSPIL